MDRTAKSHCIVKSHCKDYGYKEGRIRVIFFFAGVRNEMQLWGPVYGMDDIVPQASQHRRPLVCMQGLLIEFGLMYL